MHTYILLLIIECLMLLAKYRGNAEVLKSYFAVGITKMDSGKTISEY